ncbi:uncharacterized protein BO97DRAFT_411965 [Aspergillus homomorphus CBS 101889]|uniref:Uncharacterized protein n=1 Tax=Aspergillus homomorphus (strain CBS 101889) TaxID=1450537 RepID=A0A395I628_ASPHC|nr:hypothetical protein BO97DRAFT_411965 [Aspergillus homomorphus CBS 101889]RAL15209.1 hypothetical protein BO97DRAFT_411965 [Aspergillus homomorphus CBS 101889]
MLCSSTVALIYAGSISPSIQLFSVLVIGFISFRWTRHLYFTVSQPEITIASLTEPSAPASSPEVSSSPSPSGPEQPDQDQEEVDYPLTRLPYNEDTIVGLVSEVYRIYIQLGFINNRANGEPELVWPPPNGHSINKARCEELNLSPKVISLMQRLPYPVTSHLDIPFIPGSKAMVYIDDDQILDGRDPDRWEFDTPRKDFLLPHEIALATRDDEGINLNLNTEENSPSDDEDGNTDYRSLYGHHAPTFLAEYVNRLRCLEIIPGGARNYRWFYNEDDGKAKILREQYGWPYDFREAEWKAAVKDVQGRMDELRNWPAS